MMKKIVSGIAVSFCFSLHILASAPAPTEQLETGHQLFAKAATREEYERVVEKYDAELKASADEKERAIIITNRGEAKLALGDIQAGFADRESRCLFPSDTRLAKKGTYIETSQPLADGESVAGKTLAVYVDEGGLGDAYFFLHHAGKEARKQGARILAVTPSPFFKKVLDTMKGDMVDETALFEGQSGMYKGSYDKDIHMMSLLTKFSSEGLKAATLQTIPRSPYTDGMQELVGYWQQKIDEKPGMHVAYCVAASPMPAGVYRRLDRDIDGEILEKTMAPHAAQMYCIQGPGYTPKVQGVVNVADDEKKHGVPFAHTVALLTACKKSGRCLFVGVDTGPTNAAIAVGTKGYVMLPRVSDWRWGVPKTQKPSEDQTPSVFAPDLKKLQQDTQGDWSEPLAKLGAALAQDSNRVKDTGVIHKQQ